MKKKTTTSKFIDSLLLAWGFIVFIIIIIMGAKWIWILLEIIIICIIFIRGWRFK